MEREALQMCLEYIETNAHERKHVRHAIQAALAQPVQEPVAWPCLIAEADFSQDTVTLTMQCDDYKVSAHKHWLSTTPPKREWVGLTDDELADCLDMSIQKTCRAIEAKLKEKNT